MIPLSWSEVHFAQTWAFAVVALVLLAPALGAAVRSWIGRRSAADADFVSPEMRDALMDLEPGQVSFTRTVGALYWLCALFLALALTRPQWGVIEETVHRKGLDILIAIDVSSSMRAEDVAPSRMENARQELAFLVEELQGNRIGLIGFAGASFLFCPLTTDTDAVEMFLDEMTIEAVPLPGTALGDAIRRAIETFKLSEQSQSGGSKVLLLLTDGEDHESQPVEAAKAASKAGIVIDTIGLGTAEGGFIPDPQTGDVVRDESGNKVLSKLEGAILKEIAESTGGVYMRLDESKNGLTSYLETLRRRETRSLGETVDVRRHERFPYFLVISALAFMLALVLEEWDKRR
jgi:Ca-activated chloride channel family protein